MPPRNGSVYESFVQRIGVESLFITCRNNVITSGPNSKRRSRGRPLSGGSNLKDHFRPHSKTQSPRNRMSSLVAGGGYVPDRQLLAIPFRSELIHCVA